MKDKLLIKFKGQNNILYYNFLFSANAHFSHANFKNGCSTTPYLVKYLLE